MTRVNPPTEGTGYPSFSRILRGDGIVGVLLGTRVTSGVRQKFRAGDDRGIPPLKKRRVGTWRASLAAGHRVRSPSKKGKALERRQTDECWKGGANALEAPWENGLDFPSGLTYDVCLPLL